ncbi:MAG TPA: hypothetical protein ENG84_02540 [Gammaproteobacteria bacterium]|nr:hypothetical protein [Chromatiales bacterium]HDK02719.1 hypothetical protein [Gammaproteobacteria bacterium]
MSKGVRSVDRIGRRRSPRPAHRSHGAGLSQRARRGVRDGAQSWFREGYVDPNLDGAAFTGGRVALAWGGHWNYPCYHRALGRDLVLMPLPRFGPRLVTDSGSWNWGITIACRCGF